MFLEKIKANENFKKLILLIAVVMLAMVLVPAQAHAESAVKTKKVTMRVGQSVQLQLKGVNETLKWKSLNKKKLSVTNTGLITAKKKGTATIRVRYGGVTYKFIVNIKKQKKNQKTTVKTVTMKLKKTAGSVAETSETEETTESETFTPAKYAGLKTVVDPSLKFAEKNLIMVGDSRFAGMKAAVGGSAKWYCKVGMGLTWLQETVNLPKKISNGKLDVSGKAIVFNLGVNDIGNVKNYISYLNTLGEILRSEGASVYFMTVNPVEDKAASKWSVVRNDMVITFNKKMVAGLKGFGIIDTYDELIFQKFSTVDGVHYTTDTYKKIYNYMKSCICA